MVISLSFVEFDCLRLTATMVKPWHFRHIGYAYMTMVFFLCRGTVFILFACNLHLKEGVQESILSLKTTCKIVFVHL